MAKREIFQKKRFLAFLLCAAIKHYHPGLMMRNVFFLFFAPPEIYNWYKSNEACNRSGENHFCVRKINCVVKRTPTATTTPPATKSKNKIQTLFVCSCCCVVTAIGIIIQNTHTHNHTCTQLEWKLHGV